MFYLDLFGALAAGGVDYVVVGSLALNLDGVNSVTKNIAGLIVAAAGIDDLIALKRDTGRAIDIADIEALEKLMRVRSGRS